MSHHLQAVGAIIVAVVLSPVRAQAVGEKVSLSATKVTGGTPVEAKVEVASPRNTDTDYKIILSYPALPDTKGAALRAGLTSAPFKIFTAAVGQKHTASICVSSQPPACDATATLEVVPPVVESLRFVSTTVTTGSPFQGEVVLTGPAPGGGIEVDLAQSPAAIAPHHGPDGCLRASVAADAPNSVWVLSGQRSRTFTIPTYHPLSGTWDEEQILVAARTGTVEKTQVITVEELKISSLTLQPNQGVRPFTATLSFNLNGSAPASQPIHAAISDHPNDPMLGQGSVAAGQSGGSFPVTFGTNGKATGALEVVVRTTCVDAETVDVQVYAPPK